MILPRQTIIIPLLWRGARRARWFFIYILIRNVVEQTGILESVISTIGEIPLVIPQSFSTCHVSLEHMKSIILHAVFLHDE